MLSQANASSERIKLKTRLHFFVNKVANDKMAYNLSGALGLDHTTHYQSTETI
jgi:hypothetical protein